MRLGYQKANGFDIEDYESLKYVIYLHKMSLNSKFKFTNSTNSQFKIKGLNVKYDNVVFVFGIIIL